MKKIRYLEDYQTLLVFNYVRIYITWNQNTQAACQTKMPCSKNSWQKSEHEKHLCRRRDNSAFWLGWRESRGLKRWTANADAFTLKPNELALKRSASLTSMSKCPLAFRERVSSVFDTPTHIKGEVIDQSGCTEKITTIMLKEGMIQAWK